MIRFIAIFLCAIPPVMLVGCGQHYRPTNGGVAALGPSIMAPREAGELSADKKAQTGSLTAVGIPSSYGHPNLQRSADGQTMKFQTSDKGKKIWALSDYTNVAPGYKVQASPNARASNN